MKRLLAPAVLAVVLSAGLAGSGLAQGDYLECAACQLILKLVDSSAPNGDQNIVVDASKQCAILPPGDREACTRFYSTYGPRFIRALKDRQAKGQSLEGICKEIGYCG